MIRAFALATIYKRALESYQRERERDKRESRRASPTVAERRPDEASRPLEKYRKNSNRRRSRIENCNGTATAEDLGSFGCFFFFYFILFYFIFFSFFLSFIFLSLSATEISD
ncbi:hypothetical protein L873DRAFT_515260 [Choiromyces venosus 120613-1]|uniref:Uncharacterized protein n=1 Tax=Choiromyces venosus 120613-1 TaxID=1336337 RepID=A0A3N4IVE7_9PEZI|nr:hypothetical protein L873DRAFT_515260 [Choiromyces venosus 120613-1]